MALASTEYGTEIAFEIRDPERQAACLGQKNKMAWRESEVRLVAGDRALVPIPGPGTRNSIGQHEFGFFGKRVVFDPLPPAPTSVRLEVGGELGAWNVPMDLVSLVETDAVVARPIDAEQERNGVTVRVIAVAMTPAALVIDIEADAGRTARAIDFGSWPPKGRSEFALIDGAGRRFEEISLRDRMGTRQLSGRTAVFFPPVDSRAVTISVPAVVFQESEGDA